MFLQKVLMQGKVDSKQAMEGVMMLAKKGRSVKSLLLLIQSAIL